MAYRSVQGLYLGSRGGHRKMFPADFRNRTKCACQRAVREQPSDKNKPQHTSKIPDEILLKIFGDALFPEFCPSHLTTVCARWRALIMHSPTLWGRVLMRAKYFSMYRLAAHLALSKPCPLDIRFVDQLAETRWITFKKIITPHTSRLRSIVVRFDRVDDLVDFFQLWASSWITTHLKSLCIILNDLAPPAWQMESELPPPFSWSDVSVEALTTLKLSGYLIGNFPVAPNLTFLSLDEMNGDTTGFKYLQDNYPLLETLVVSTLRLGDKDDYVESPMVELTSLRALAFSPTSEFLDYMFDSISIPNLSRLHTIATSGGIPLLTRCAAMKNLRELYIAFTWIGNGELTPEDVNEIGGIPQKIDLILQTMPKRDDSIRALHRLTNLRSLRFDPNALGLFEQPENEPEQDWFADSDSESEEEYLFKEEPDDEDIDDPGDGTYVPYYNHYSRKSQLKSRRGWY